MANFIITAVSSIVKGAFKIVRKLGTGAGTALFQMNPEAGTQDGVPAASLQVGTAALPVAETHYGNSQINGALGVSGALSGASGNITGNLTVGGAITAGGTMTAADGQINNNLSVGGQVSANTGNFSNLILNGNNINNIAIIQQADSPTSMNYPVGSIIYADISNSMTLNLAVEVYAYVRPGYAQSYVVYGSDDTISPYSTKLPGTWRCSGIYGGGALLRRVS